MSELWSDDEQKYRYLIENQRKAYATYRRMRDEQEDLLKGLKNDWADRRERRRVERAVIALERLMQTCERLGADYVEALNAIVMAKMKRDKGQ